METLSSRYAMALRESASWYGAVTIDELAGRVCDALLVLIPADGVGWTRSACRTEPCASSLGHRTTSRRITSVWPSWRVMNPFLPDHEQMIEPFGHGRAWIMINEQWPAIKADIDAGKLSPLGLIRVKSANPGELGQNHQVLAYGYDLNGTSLALHVYDPNRRDDDSVHLSLDIGDPDHTTAVTYTGDSEPVYCFFRTPYGWKDPSAIAGTVHGAQPVQLGTLTVAVQPFNAAFGQQVSVTVSAVDAKTNAPVAGDVSIDGVVGRTNAPFAHTFRDYPIGMVHAVGYEDAWVSFGSTREEDQRIPKARPNNFRAAVHQVVR